MNLENVNKAIAIMERVKARGDRLNMCSWQEPQIAHGYLFEEQELHTCGSSACLAGWVAVSPEWKEAEGEVSRSGLPEITDDHGDELNGESAIGYWLGIDDDEAWHLCGLSLASSNKQMAEIELDDVLAALYRLRDTGSVYLHTDVVYPKESAQ